MVRPKEKRLRVVRPNLGLEIEYRCRLHALIEEMHNSALWWIKASYKANEPKMAQDELPATALRKAVRKLATRWQERFDEMAPKLAEWFTKTSAQRSDTALRRILRDGGLTVQFKMTAPVRDIMQASIAEQVSLIKSIPAQYLTQVEGSVMRSVQAGRDFGTLAKELQQHYGVTKRRAAFIARDQNAKATATITRARQIETGVGEAIWVHSGGGNHPRPTHLKAGRDRTRYDVRKGWFDPDAKEWIVPGQLPNCRCVSRSVISGFV